MLGLFRTNPGLERGIIKYANRAAHLDIRNRALKNRIRKLESSVQGAVAGKNARDYSHYLSELREVILESIELHGRELEDLENIKKSALFVEAHKISEIDELNSKISGLKSRKILTEQDAKILSGKLDDVRSALHSRLSRDKWRESRLKSRSA